MHFPGFGESLKSGATQNAVSEKHKQVGIRNGVMSVFPLLKSCIQWKSERAKSACGLTHKGNTALFFRGYSIDPIYEKKG